MAENESDISITADTLYLALTGELWGVYCEDFEKNDRITTAPHCIYINISFRKLQKSTGKIIWKIRGLILTCYS